MASLRKHPKSPFWFACFTLSDGRRTQRSTGTTDKRKAKDIAHQYEKSSREAKAGLFIESRARKVIADIFALANPDTLQRSTVGDFLDAWLKRKELEAGESTHRKYVSVIDRFKRHLGQKVKRDITTIKASDITAFRDSLMDTVSAGTANVALKIIRVAFSQAHKDGLIDVNEAARVSTFKRRDENRRKAFTLGQVKDILKEANDEWRGMILFGLYTGQRLGDIARLTWANIDLERKELRMVTGKTGRTLLLPLATPLLRYVESLPAGDNPEQPLFPKSCDIANRHQSIGNLSNQFYGILVAAGLAKKKSHEANPENKEGRSGRRQASELSFHSLRHTATTLLKAAGVGDSVAMEFIGHDSASVSRSYTHIPSATLRAAANKLPDVTK